MKKHLVPAILLSSLLICNAREFVVIDSSDGARLSGATVIGNSGLILGITDLRGAMPEPDVGQFPLTIRNVGYEPIKIDSFADTIKLQPAVYSLNEIEVNPGSRPIKRVISYAREYATGATTADTMQLYSEYMLESFIKDDDVKVKGYKDADASPKVKNVRRYARFTNSEGLDSVMVPKSNDDIVMLSWAEIMSVPNIKVEESPSIVAGATCDTVMGKYGPINISRKNSGVYSVSIDRLAQYKDHKWSPFFFKLLGMTMEIDNLKLNLGYLVNDTGKYTLDDFIYSTYSIHLLAKGKIFKKIFKTPDPIDLDTYIEFYPVSITYLTPEEYKELRSDKEEMPFKTSPNVQPLPDAIDKLVKRVNSEEK